MTTPDERIRVIGMAHEFMLDLLDPKKTPGVPDREKIERLERELAQSRQEHDRLSEFHSSTVKQQRLKVGELEREVEALRKDAQRYRAWRLLHFDAALEMAMHSSPLDRDAAIDKALKP